ncbi:hypothetical protein EDC04DRAFT_2995460 [Pisolithus marmoratus]|nr:hypothetical protein EDC04DRAFT_2995460 [Pisolithus marmoratus]
MDSERVLFKLRGAATHTRSRRRSKLAFSGWHDCEDSIAGTSLATPAWQLIALKLWSGRTLLSTREVPPVAATTLLGENHQNIEQRQRTKELNIIKTYKALLWSLAEDDRLAVLDPVAEKGNFFHRTTVPTAHMGCIAAARRSGRPNAIAMTSQWDRIAFAPAHYSSYSNKMQLALGFLPMVVDDHPQRAALGRTIAEASGTYKWNVRASIHFHPCTLAYPVFLSNPAKHLRSIRMPSLMPSSKDKKEPGAYFPQVQQLLLISLVHICRIILGHISQIWPSSGAHIACYQSERRLIIAACRLAVVPQGMMPRFGAGTTRSTRWSITWVYTNEALQPHTSTALAVYGRP